MMTVWVMIAWERGIAAAVMTVWERGLDVAVMTVWEGWTLL